MAAVDDVKLLLATMAQPGRDASRVDRKRFVADEIIFRDDARAEPLLIESGWAYRVRDFRDGRRQILTVSLPGEVLFPHLVGGQGADDAKCLTAMVCRVLPLSTHHFELIEALRANERRWIDNQVLRIGRMSARERLAHLLIELRLRSASAEGRLPTAFKFPLTQDQLGDLIGLTSIHVNRTLQAMRAAKEISLASRQLEILDPEALKKACPVFP